MQDRRGRRADGPSGRRLQAAGTFYSNARCNAIRCNPWASLNKQVKHVVIEGDAGAVAGPCANYWFYGCSALERVDGMSALLGVVQMQHTFNSCTALETLDLRGFEPGSLANLTYTFGGCSKLRTILVDASWKLSASGLSAFGTFRSCTSIVDGVGTAYDDKKASGAMMRIDAAGAPGYLTAG